MDEKHPSHADPRPKRRKDKDNPYEIFTTGAGTSFVRYYIRFKDGTGSEHCLEIEKNLFDLLDRFELDDLRHLNEVDKHYEHSELTEATLNERAFLTPPSLESIVSFRLECEELHRAIDRLPIVQRRRLILCYFSELTHEQIAEMEVCSRQAIENSVKAALKKLKIYLN